MTDKEFYGSSPELLGVQGLLVDLDGVLYIGDEVLEGAVTTLELLKSAGFPIRCVTNTTTKSTSTLARRLETMGLPVEANEIVNAPKAAVQYLRSLDSPRVRLVLSEDAATEFSEFEADAENPDVVVIGDIGSAWDYDLLSELFGHLVGGAGLVALHKGRYYQGSEGLVLDIGGFVAALEYSSGIDATVIGKPSKRFFQMAVRDMGLEPHDVAMVGDDIDSDVGGAKKGGLKGILVKTGKYREQLVRQSDVVPDAVIGSIKDLPQLLGL